MAPVPSPPVPRIITYYQTHHDAQGKLISPLSLIQQPGIGLTHLILAAIHLNEDPDGMTLNDHHPSHERFITLWAHLRVLQAAGIKVLGMLGGAAQGSYARLDGSEAQFERYYVPLRDMVRTRGLDGLDLDVEEVMSLGGVVRLIDRLRADFGPDFIITLAPVAAALLDSRRNLSGFDYEALEVMRGKDIAWYNSQFYCGWGDCSNPLMYEMILMKGWPAEKVVIGLVTNPENGPGFVPWHVLGNVLPLILGRHPRFGGVMGWEYFNSLPGGRERPWEWARWMTALLKGERTVLDDIERVTGERVVGLPLPTSGAADKNPGHIDRAPAEVDHDDTKAEDAPVPDGFEYYSDGGQ
ncbi:glycoside hydrolase family 18 protein [Thozetella sp. PMI_491]|nr:glycoside hydrolase family 18 protein [Thozetella sp. PMI_491]